MLRSQFAICALDFIKKNSPKPLSDEHLKLISLSLQTNDRLTSANQSQLKTDFYKNAMVLEGLTSARSRIGRPHMKCLPVVVSSTYK